ncbi:MAG: hypothetical protein PHY47_00340 [Lachnospiraceae bacterium]|nr:hypothetical protein [Lachnospiraceae bacterium]
MANENSKVEVWFRPNWHPALNNLLGKINGQYAYITSVGTIELLGPLHEDPDISKFANESETRGPTVSLSAIAGLGL